MMRDQNRRQPGQSGTGTDSNLPEDSAVLGTVPPAPSLLPRVELDQQQIDALVRSVPGGASNVKDVYPLSPLQEGMLFHYLLNAQDDTYVLSTLLELQDHSQVGPFITALQRVIDRHDALRTAVLWDNLPRAVQVVHVCATLPVEHIELDSSRDFAGQLRDRMMPKGKKLNLQQAPLMVLQLATDSGSGRIYALLQVHHLICDHESLRLVISESLACLAGCEVDLAAPPAYGEHVPQIVVPQSQQDAEAFFRGKLADVTEPTALFDIHDVRGNDVSIEEASELIDAALALDIRSEARRLGVSAARVFHAAWGLVVAHASGRDDVVYGTVLSTRPRGVQARQLVGMFVNTLPLRLRIKGLTAREMLAQTHIELAQLAEHQQVPLTTAQRCTSISGAAPPFTSLLNYRHRGASQIDAYEGVSGVTVLARGEAWTNYPVTMVVDDLGEGFSVTAQTDSRIAPHRVLKYLHQALRSFVNALREGSHAPVLTLSILPDCERQQLIGQSNPKRTAPSPRTLIHHLLEEQVKRTPSGVAVVCEDGQLTYADLNARANQLARELMERGVGPDRTVAICMERGLDLVVGMLAVLKAGGAYVPLDPHYPADRLRYMLNDAAPCVLLVQEGVRAVLPETQIVTIALDREAHLISRHSADDIGRDDIDAHNLAYVIYTSGSTGAPKGVMIEHQNVTRLFSATEQWFGFNAQDVWTLFHSFAFDFSVWELWGALFYGGRVVVVPYLRSRSPKDFYEFLCEEGVTVLNQTPSAFTQLIEAQSSSRRPHSLRYVIFGGEALEPRTLRQWVERNGIQRPQLINMYGITETTVHVTYRPLVLEDIESGTGSPIGRPIPDLRTYILDRYLQPVPIGVVGEICVGGAGVARGYLNRSARTAEKFMADGFTDDAQSRLYRSGDVGRWLCDGSIEHLGRNDDQVKIRGFRIELGEIEAHLLRHDQVREARVIASGGGPGEKRLVAYVIASAPESPPSADTLRTYLKSVLPEHMVPAAYVLLERIPLTVNGKLDRRMLPVPENAAYASRQYEAPQGELEDALAHIWCELLNLERVGRQDDFFDMGGHSILAMQASSRIKSKLAVDVPVGSLFKFSTLEQLANHVNELRQASFLESIGNDKEIEALIERVASMPQSEAQQLLRELMMKRSM